RLTPRARLVAAACPLLEPRLAQPLGRDPLLACGDRRTAVQRPRRRVRPVVAEEDRIALDRGDLEADVGKDRRAAGLRRVEIADDRGDALAAALEDRRRAGLGGVEVVVVRAVLGAGPVAQHLQA